MTPVTMTPNQPRVWRSVETADGGQRKIRKGRDISDISNITKNNDPLSQSAPFSLTSQPQIERELCGVTCSHDDCRVHPNSEFRIPRLDLTQLTDQRWSRTRSSPRFFFSF